MLKTTSRLLANGWAALERIRFRRSGNFAAVLFWPIVSGISFAAFAAPVIPQDEGGKPVAAYLPAGLSFDTRIPTPEAYLGSNVGAWHVRHDQLVGYMRLLAEVSPRISLEETGRTHENRPLLLLTISSEANQGRLDELRQQHLNTIQTGKPASSDSPLVFYLGYSIHGNEPSGSNASMVIAYYLAAAQGPEIERLLANNVVLLDPSFNPDGLSRFAQWANMHKGKQLVADSDSREHQEGWPSGRTNHYWFDLNRDWLLLTHPESRARIRQFHKWRPHVLTDHHEMGTNSTFFFQPGVRSRKNPLTPEGNVTLTEALAQYHAKAFDKAGKLYFSQEDFDDFYHGKGSTYPDAHGSIGILFEQASSRGHLQESINGELAFADTIQNHVTTTLSTLEGSLDNKPAILKYQNQFHNETQTLIKEDDHAGYLVSIEGDPGRFQAMLDILAQHQIHYQVLNDQMKTGEQTFPAGSSVFIALDQPQYRLIRSLFSTQTNFVDNTFYDVSNWNLPLAFNAHYAQISQRESRGVKTRQGALALADAVQAVAPGAYAYAFDWQHYYSPALLQSLLEAGVQVRTAGSPFSATLVNGEVRPFAEGTIVVPAALQQPADLADLLSGFSTQLSVPVYAIQSGLTPAGIDLGSRKMAPVTLPQVMLVGGEGTSQSEVGEIWHYLDTRVGLPASLVEQQHLAKVNLTDYTHMIFTSGSYNGLDDDTKSAIGEWVAQGGVLIGERTALRFFAKQGWLDVNVLSDDKIDDAFATDNLSYADKEALYAKKIIAGAVYETRIDPSHPLFYGYADAHLPVFKSSNMIVKSNNSPFTTVARYTSSPLMAGYSAGELVSLIADTTAAVAQPKGNGVVIGLVDNPMFRGYWYGTDKLLSNAIYQSALID